MNHLNSKYFLLISLLSLTFITKGQDYLTKMECLSVEEGLSNRFVRSIVQDYKGFIWVATNYGLNRYDGNQFKVFTKEEHQLQRNIINQLYEDPDSNIWIGYSNKNHDKDAVNFIDLLDINKQTFQPIEQSIQLPFDVDELQKIYTVPTNKYLYLTTKGGQIYVYKGKNEFELFYTHDKKNSIQDFLEGTSYYWLLSGNELLALDKNRKLVNRTILDEKANFNRCNIIGERNNQSIWVLLHYLDGNIKKNWIWKLDSTQQDRNILDDFMDTTRMAFDTRMSKQSQTNCSVFQNRRQLALFDDSGQLVYHYLVPGDYFGTVYIDKQENIWCEINKKGLCKFSYQKNKFNSYFKGKPLRAMTYLPGDSILLTNSYSGILIHNLRSNKTKIEEGLGLDVLKSRDGKRFWISSEYRNLEEYDLNTFKRIAAYDFYAKDKQRVLELSNGGIILNWALYEDKNSSVWLGTSNGVAYLDKGHDSLQLFRVLNEFDEFSTAVVNYFYENKQGLWAATSLGLYLIDKEKGIVQKYSKESAGNFKIPHNYILNIHEDKEGLFWLSTRGGGIIKLNIATGAFEQFTTKQGLSHNVVYAILEDEQHDFWMSSDYGLMHFNPRNYVVNTYLPRDGLLHEEFNHTSAYKAPDGRLYFGGVAGAVSFKPNDFLVEENYQAPLQIIRFQYFDGRQSVLLDRTNELIQKPEIVLNYTDRFFLLEFALLDYNLDKENQYAYKIEGLDKDWHYINSNSIRINGLAAGAYTLEIKGQGNNGTWSSRQLKIPILIKQPFYLTWQFFLFLIILALGYFRWRVIRFRKAKEKLEHEVQKRTKKIEEQANKLKELDNVKSRFFANISHELRTPLTLIMGPISAILEKHYGNDWEKIISILEVAKRNGHKLQNLIEEILLLSKLEANSLELEEKELVFFPFLRRVFLAFEAQAHLQGINLTLNYELDKNLAVLLDENKFEKIINNLLSNALKYTPRGGSIELNVGQDNIKDDLLELQLDVIDSGKGIFPEDLPFIFNRFYQSKHKEAIVQGGTGIGLALSYEFAQLLGGNLTVESSLGVGSTFSLNIPIKVVLKTSSADIKEELLVEEVEELVVPVASANKATILVVEDNDDMRLFVADLLSAYYNILTAENGKIALDILEEKASTVDLVLSDVMMPELDGFQLLERIKGNSAWQQLPIIMLTARTAEQDKLFALRIGVDDYLPKPFSRQELLVRIQNLLQNYQQRKAWQQEISSLEVDEAPEKIETEERDEWLEELEKRIKKEVGNSQFGVTSLAADLEMSERHLRRIIKTKTGLSPNQYFRLIKLDVARQYLESKKYSTVAKVAQKIAFSNVNYFSKIYFEQYGKKPIEYLKNA